MARHSDKKIMELIIYIAAKCSDIPDLGKTKLNKILFLTDFHYYLNTRKSITNHEYVHLPHGPIPNDMDDILAKMQREQAIGIAYGQNGPFRQTKIVALREPDLSLFTAEIIAFVDSIIEKTCRVKATRLSGFTHDMMGWLITRDGETIPYQTIYLKSKAQHTVTAWEKTRAAELAKKFSGQYGFT